MEKNNDIKDLSKKYKINKKDFIDNMFYINNKIKEYDFVIDYMSSNDCFYDEKIINDIEYNINKLKDGLYELNYDSTLIDYNKLLLNFKLFNDKYNYNILGDYFYKNKTDYKDLTEEQKDFAMSLALKKEEIEKKNNLQQIKSYKDVYKKLSKYLKSQYDTLKVMTKKSNNLKSQFGENKENIKNNFSTKSEIIDNAQKEIYNNIKRMF